MGRSVGVGYGSAMRRRLLRGTALQAAAWVLAMPAFGQTLLPTARPLGGQVVAGQASIAASSAATVVTQASQRAVLNWSSFNVGSAHRVQFVQPDAAAITFNRVLGPDPSQIAGRVTANGQLVLVNQSGVVFTGSAQVNVQSLVVSTANISDRNAMAGRLAFDQPGRPGAMVVNQGAMSVKDTGLAALVAPAVANAGTITARMGRVVLASGTRATLDLYGDGLLPIDVTGQVQQVPVGPDGRKVAALVTNTGTILAPGGQVALSARAVDGLVQDLVSAGGRIAVDNANGAGGRVVLQGIGGSVTMPGRISATGRTGGQVSATATRGVTLAGGGAIDASGRTGGGSVSLRGRSATVAAGARIAADATGSGTGGHVAVIGSKAVAMHGRMSATGGTAGGAVEVSGRGALSLTGGIDVGARAGAAGSILIDPASLTIETNGSLSLGGSTLAVATLDRLTGHVVLEATDGIVVLDAVTMTQPGASLSLLSGGDITVRANITVPGSLDLQAGLPLAGAPAAGNIMLQTGVQLQGLSVALAAIQSGTLGGSIAVSGLAGITAAQRITLSGAVTGGTLETGSASVAPLQLGGDAPGGGTLWVSDVLPAGFVAGAGLRPGTLLVGASGGVTTASGIDVAGLILRGGNRLVPVTLDLRSSGDVSETVGAGLAGIALLTGTVGGSVTLGQSAFNHIAALGEFTAGGGFTLGDAPASGTLTLVAGATLTAAAATLSVPGGALALDGSIAGVATLALSAGGAIVQNGGVLAAGTLFGTAGGNASLDGANQIAALGAFTAGGALTLADATGLTVSGAVHAAAAALAVSAGDLVIGGGLAAPGGIALTALSGSVSETLPGAATATGVLATGRLTAMSGGDVSLTGANTIATLGLVAAKDALSVNDTRTMAVDSAVSGGVALSTTAGSLLLQGEVRGLTDVQLQAAGDITQTAGRVAAGTLAASAGGAIALSSDSNKVIEAIGLAAGSSLLLVDSEPLVVRGPVSGNGVSLQADGLTLASAVTVPADASLALVSAGAITEASGGSVAAGLLSVAATGAVTLTQPGNLIGALAGVAVPGSGFALSDAGALSVHGPVIAGTIALQATALTLAGTIAGGAGGVPAAALALTASGGGIVQTGGGIAASSLTLNSTGSVSLPDAGNAIASLAGASLPGQTLALTDAAPLGIAGPLSAGTITLQAPTLTLTGTIAATQLVTLLAGGGGIQQIGGSLATPRLNAISAGDIVLPSENNAIQTLGSVTAPNSNVSVLNGGNLIVAGPLQASLVALLTLNGNITLSGNVTAGFALSLSAAGDLLQTAGSVQAGAGGLIASAGSGSLLQSGGTLLSGSDITLLAGSTANDAISLGGHVQAAGTLDLLAGGNIDEGVAKSGRIAAATLTGSAGGGVSLAAGGNTVATVQDFTAGGAALVLYDAAPLAVAGSVGNCAGAVTLASAGAMTIGGIGAPATLYATGDLALAASDRVALAGARTLVIAQGSIAIATRVLRQSGGLMAAAGDLGVAGSVVQSGGSIATAAAFALTGSARIGGLLAARGLAPALTDTDLRWLTLAGGTLSTTESLSLGHYSLAGGNRGTIATAGSVRLASLAIAGGAAILADGDVTIAGTLAQSGGTVSAGGALSVGDGSGPAAGVAGVRATAGGIAQTGGTLVAAGAIDLWSTTAATLGGAVLAGGTLGATAFALNQTSGLLFGAAGVALLATAGDAAQAAGATVASGGAPISVLAPSGRNGVNDFASASLQATPGSAFAVAVDCGCSGQPPEASPSAVASFAATSGAVGALGSSAGLAVTLQGESIGIDRPLVAGTLALSAATTITQASGAGISVGTLTGTAGSVALLSGSNSVASVDGFAAGGDLRLRAAAPDGTLVLGGRLSAGGGNTLEIDTGAAMALGSGVVVTGGGVILTGASKQFAGALVDASGAAGLALAGGGSTVAPGSLLVATAGGITGDQLVQTGGSIGAAGPITLAGLDQSAGVLAATGDIALGQIARASGTVGTGGDLSGAVAGLLLDGTLAAVGNLLLQSAGSLTLSGTLAAQGSVTVTAASLLQSAGLISGAAGVALTAGDGDARQAAGAAVGGNPGPSGAISVQAGNGTVAFASFVAADAVSRGTGAVPLPVVSPPTSAASVDVTLAGGSIDIAGPLSAAALGLFATGSIGEAPGAVLDVQSLTGSAGGAVLLPDANRVASIAGFRAGQDFSLTVSGDTAVVGAVQAADVALAVGGALAISANVTAAGSVGRLAASAARIAVTDGAVLQGWRIALTAADSITAGLDGTVTFAGGGQPGPAALTGGQAGFSPPHDNTTAATPGVFLAIGSPAGAHDGLNAATGSGTIDLGSVVVSGGVLRLALPDNLAGQPGSLASSGSILLGTVAAPASDLILWIGDGAASGNLSALQLAVFYTGASAHADLGGVLYTAQGSAVTGTAASFLAGVGRYRAGDQITYSPLPSMQFAGCPISSINCQIVDLRQTIPPLTPVENDSFTLSDAPDDPDVLLPNISDRDF